MAMFNPQALFNQMAQQPRQPQARQPFGGYLPPGQGWGGAAAGAMQPGSGLSPWGGAMAGGMQPAQPGGAMRPMPQRPMMPPAQPGGGMQGAMLGGMQPAGAPWAVRANALRARAGAPMARAY